jgi:beta-N-acetylhexosaminidase
MRLTSLFAGLAVVVLLAPARADEKKVSIRGSLASAGQASEDEKKGGLLGNLLVEGSKDKDTEYDKATVKVTKATKIYRQIGRELKEASFDDLKGGVKVEIWFQGPVAESFPVQATAGKIVITR